MPKRRRARFVPLATLARRADIEAGRVLVDGRVVHNPRAQVRADAAVRVLPPKALRGEAKLGAALAAFGLDLTGLVAVDVGAAAGGFTTALLAAGARRVYAVDVGYGQLRGSLRADPRVVNMERTNVADLALDEPVDVVTMDLSFLSVADAAGQLDGLRFAAGARLLALVKPTFELHRGEVVRNLVDARQAVAAAIGAVERHGWRPLAVTLPSETGRHGAVEAFVLAQRHA